MAPYRRAIAAAAVIAALIAGLGFLPWFHAAISTPLGDATIQIGLRRVEACAMGVCQSEAMGKLRGSYGTFAGLTFWIGAGFALLLLAQAATALRTGVADARLGRPTLLAGVGALVCGLAASFVFGPDTGGGEAEGFALEVAHASGGWITLGGLIAGLVVASLNATELPAAPLAPPLAHAYARARSSTAPADHGALAVGASPASPASSPVATDAASPTDALPRYAATIAALSHTGLDVRRVDGARAVAWADVVGVITRALPDGTPFVDVVSTAGATVRLGPWTELSGARVPGIDARDPRASARALAAHVRDCAPGAKLDGATRAFVDGALADPPALADAAALAGYDDRLA
jgi:hypothetical protein